jgi:catechol 2,3-dioxygenase-like lactoylglutathione lyase family enzyme
MLLPRVILCACIVAISTTSVVTAQTAAGHVTGVGGIFVASKDPKKLAAWYRDVLGVDLAAWGGVKFDNEAARHAPATAWFAYRDGSDFAAPSTRDFMIDFAVDDLDAFVARLKSKGVVILKRDDSDPSGAFAWILDPDGTKIELWQPKAAAR